MNPYRAHNPVMRSYGKWALVLLVPPLVNGALWVTLVIPQQRREQSQRSMRTMTDLKPKLETLLNASSRLVAAAKQPGGASDDPSAAIQRVQRLADRHRVRLSTLKAGGKAAALDVEATGRFSKLARWLGDVEAQPGLRIESWNMTPGEQFGGPAHATVKLSTMGGALGPPAVSGKGSTERYEQTADELAQAVHTAQALEEQAGGYDAVFSRDPLKALIDAQGRVVSATGFSGELAVQGIMWSQERPLAVVDDELYATGDSVGPYTIVEIRQEGVVVARDGATLFVPLDRGVGLPPPE